LASLPVGPGSPLASGSGVAGSPLASATQAHIRLPVSIEGLAKGVFAMSDWPTPAAASAATEKEEEEHINLLINDLNKCFNLDLDTTTSHLRKLTTPSEPTVAGERCTRVYIAGGSHAGRLAAALEDEESIVTVDLAMKGWSVTEDNVNTLADNISNSTMTNQADTVIIYQMFDNSTYRSCTGPGLFALPRKDKTDGKYHVEGRLTLADRAAFKEIFNVAVPALRAGGDCRKIIITPLTRYLTGKCCTDPGHITNYTTAEYEGEMCRGLRDIRKWIAEFAYTKRIQNFTVMDPVKCLVDLDSEETDYLIKLWGRDPVHMAPAGYAKLAESVLDTINNSDTKYERCGEDSKPIASHSSSDRCQQRQSWVARSDSALKRNYDLEPAGRGGGRGQHWRGNGGGGSYSWRGRSRGGRRGYNPY